MTLPSDMNMDVNNYINFLGNVSNNYNKVRDYSLTSNNQYSKMASMFSSEHLVDYASRCECINDFIEDKQVKDPIDSLQLSYASLKE